MEGLVFPLGEKPQAPPAPANSMHPAPLLRGLILRSSSVSWPKCPSSFGGKMSSVTAVIEREQNNYSEEGKRCLYFYLGLPGQTCC